MEIIFFECPELGAAYCFEAYEMQPYESQVPTSPRAPHSWQRRDCREAFQISESFSGDAYSPPKDLVICRSVACRVLAVEG